VNSKLHKQHKTVTQSPLYNNSQLASENIPVKTFHIRCNKTLPGSEAISEQQRRGCKAHKENTMNIGK